MGHTGTLTNETDTIVIGGGVVGICCALELQEEGHHVVVVDHGAPGEGASWASCGSIAVSEVVPLSRPGTLLRVPRWLADPTGPLALRPRSAVSVLPWFLRFVGNSRWQRIRQISAELATLTRSARDDTENLLARYGLHDLLRETPVIQLYDSARELALERRFHDMRRDLGFRIDEITGAEAVEREPSLARDFACAAVFQDWCSVVEPKRFVVELHEAFARRGGATIAERAIGFVRDGDRLTGVCTSRGTNVRARQIIVSAGAQSKRFASELGLKLSMEGVIGYQTLLQSPGLKLNHALVYAKGGFGMTPYENGLAVAGGIEFADLAAVPNWRRADFLVEGAKRVLPALVTGSAQQRFGRRPLTPDTKPFIGRARGADNVIFATGHGQLGLTLGATTGHLVRDLVANRKPAIDLSAFRPDRFQDRQSEEQTWGLT